MPVDLVHLPHDLIILICTYLHPRELLDFVQTCRVIHALGTTDYVWHHLHSHDLPIDDLLMTTSGSEIKLNVIRALRLDDNWKRRASKITRISKINLLRSVIDMRPLGRDWLVVSSRSRGSSINLSVWHLDISSNDSGGFTNSSCVAFFNPPQAFSFEASLEDDGSTALICVLGASPHAAHKALLIVYQLNLKGDDSNINYVRAPRVVNEWTIEHSGVFYHSQISGSLVAAAVAHVSHSHCSHQILLLNTKTNVTVRIESSTLTNFECGRMLFKIYSRHMVIVGVYQERIKVHVRELPNKIFSGVSTCVSLEEHLIPSVDWDSFIVDFETPKIQNLEFFISPEPVYHSALDSFTVMVTHSPFSPMELGTVNIYHLPIDTSMRGLKFADWKPTHTFNTPPNVTLEPTCLGKTGHRAVWLSHRWNVDEYSLMKASFGDVIAPLQPPEQALPFEPYTCQSLFFEEATGRLFVGVHTGEIYMIEF